MRTAVAEGRPAEQSDRRRTGRLLATGLVATIAAVVATTLLAASARAVGVDFELSDGQQAIPLAGFAVMTGVFSAVGVVLAATLLRWSVRPADRFVRSAVALTGLSLVAPFLVGADAATSAALVVLHLVAAAVMIPAVAWSLGGRAR